MAVPMKNGGMKISKVIFYVILSGITTGIGAFFGAIIGSISEQVIAICLSFAARSHVIHCIRRTSTRSKQLISWKNDSTGKYDRIFNRNFCNGDLEVGTRGRRYCPMDCSRTISTSPCPLLSLQKKIKTLDF